MSEEGAPKLKLGSRGRPSGSGSSGPPPTITRAGSSPSLRLSSDRLRKSNERLVGVALDNYEGETAEDISFSKGDRITVVKQSEGKWVGKTEHGDQGTFPPHMIALEGEPVKPLRSPAKQRELASTTSISSSAPPTSPLSASSGTILSSSSSGSSSSSSSSSASSSAAATTPAASNSKSKGGLTLKGMTETLRSKASSAMSTAQAVTKSAKDAGAKALQKGKGMISRSGQPQEKSGKDDSAKADLMSAFHFVFDDLFKEERTGDAMKSFFHILYHGVVRHHVSALLASDRSDRLAAPFEVGLGATGDRLTIVPRASMSDEALWKMYVQFSKALPLMQAESDKPLRLDKTNALQGGAKTEFRQAMTDLVEVMFRLNSLSQPGSPSMEEVEVLHALLNCHMPKGFRLREAPAPVSAPVSITLKPSSVPPIIVHLTMLILRKGGMGNSAIFETDVDSFAMEQLLRGLEFEDDSVVEEASLEVTARLLLRVLSDMNPPLLPPAEDCCKVPPEWSRMEEQIMSLPSGVVCFINYICAFLRLFRDVAPIFARPLFGQIPPEFDSVAVDFTALLIQNAPGRFIRDAALGYNVIITSRNTHKTARATIVSYERDKNRYIARIGGGQDVAVKDSPDVLTWLYWGEELNIPHLPHAFFAPVVAQACMGATPISALMEFFDSPKDLCGFENRLLHESLANQIVKLLETDRAKKMCTLATAKSLAEVFCYRGMEDLFLDSVLIPFVEDEIAETASIGTLFRSNSAASRIISAFIEVVGHTMLKKCLSPPLCDLVYADQERILALGPEHDPQAEEEVPYQFVATHATAIVDVIVEFLNDLPTAVRRCCALVAGMVEKKFPEEEHARHIAVGSVLFLRFFVPALMSPVDAGLLPQNTVVTPSVQRILKVLNAAVQCLANQALFSSSKPAFCLNELFIEPERNRVNDYLDQVCDFESCSVVKSAAVSQKTHVSAFSSLVVTAFILQPDLI